MAKTGTAEHVHQTTVNITRPMYPMRITVRMLAFAELGMEAIYEFEVKDMPVTVAVDTNGESVHITGPAIWQQKIADSLAVEVQ